MAAVFTIYNRPRGYNQTQKQFTLEGTTLMTGTYTSGTGFTLPFTGLLDASGGQFNMPPTYTGSNGPGQGVPTYVWIAPIAGYSFNWIGNAIRIYSAAGVEVTTGTIPAAISAAGVYTEASFLRD